MDFGVGFQVNLVDFDQHFPIDRRLKLDSESLKTAIEASYTYPRVECLDISSCGIDDASISAVCKLDCAWEFPGPTSIEFVHELHWFSWLEDSFSLLCGGTCFQGLIMLDMQHDKHPGCSAVVMAVTSALPWSAQFAERLGLYKMAFFRRKYERGVDIQMPFASLEILICTLHLTWITH